MNLRPATTTKTDADNGACALRWLLARGDERITCEITMMPDRQMEVGFFPHSNLQGAMVARFEHPTDALERHAELVCRLRDSGWSVVNRLAA